MAQYLMPAARSQSTGQLIKSQDLRGRRYTELDRDQAQRLAQRLAESLTARTRHSWSAELITYQA
jgi:hypothetical protein